MIAPPEIKTVCLMSIANPRNTTMRIRRSCDTVLWLINRNRRKPQSPVEDLCIFLTTRLPCGTNTPVVCLTAFPSRDVFCHASRCRIRTRTEKRRRFQSKRAAVSCGSFSHLCRHNATQSWGLCSRPCIMHDMVHKQYAKTFPCRSGSSIIPRLPLNL